MTKGSVIYAELLATAVNGVDAVASVPTSEPAILTPYENAIVNRNRGIQILTPGIRGRRAIKFQIAPCSPNSVPEFERHFRLGRYLLASSLARRRCGLVLCPAPAQRTGPEVHVSFMAGVLEQLVIVIAGQGHRDLPR